MNPTTTTFIIPKLRKGTNTPFFGLKTTNFIIPFPYYATADVVIALRADVYEETGTDDVLLEEGTHYTLSGSQLQINEEALGLNKSDGLSVILSATRNTILDLAIFQKGHPVKADDLNFNFEQLIYRIEENQ